MDRRARAPRKRERYLSREEELALARRYRDGDERAGEQIIRSHEMLARAMVRRVTNGDSYNYEDLLQEARFGLLEALRRFDPEQGNRFSTFAVFWVRAKMGDFFMRNWSIVRGGSSSSHKNMLIALRRYHRTGQVGNDFVHEQWAALELIAARTNISLSQVEAINARLREGDRHLDAATQPEEWGTLMADDGDSPLETLLREEEKHLASEHVRSAMVGLNDRERLIVTERHLREDPLTLRELSDLLGVSRERVRQIEEKALQKLETALRPLGRRLLLAGALPEAA